MLAPDDWLVHDDGFVPKLRYLSREYAELEADRLWKRVWQIACRAEEIPEPGDWVEYAIADQSVLITRRADGTIGAFHNACLHRGRRLRHDAGHEEVVDGAACIQCPYHGWKYALDGSLVHVVDRDDFGAVSFDGQHLGSVRAECSGGFVFVNLDSNAAPLCEFLDPLPTLLGRYRLDEMRFRSYLTTVLPANWKVAVDAFNEAYHVQSTHPQLLEWTDDVSIAYEQLGDQGHAHYGRLPHARRTLAPSPRLGLAAGDYDEGTILAGLVEGLGGAFLGDERALVEEVRAEHPSNLLGAYQARRRELLSGRGLDVGAFGDDELTSADDVYWFPNVVGPIYPGSAILFRIRPNGLDPDSCIKDTWVLEWPDADRPPRALRKRFYEQWRDRDWGEVTTQDYENMEPVQQGMRSDGYTGLRLNPRQESNVLAMHRAIDRYLLAP